MGKRLSFAEVKRKQRERIRQRQQQANEPLPEADSTEKESPGTGEEMTETGETGLTATHRGGGYYRVTNADGETVAESVSKDEAREMGAEA